MCKATYPLLCYNEHDLICFRGTEDLHLQLTALKRVGAWFVWKLGQNDLK